jgi:energy-coupling factor transporter ATP-binding protein EcfA2
LIRLREFSFSYNGAEKPALNRINLTIEDGQFVLITGASGGGKSTLCRCCNGLVPHFYGGRIGGKAEVQGIDILAHPPKELATKVGMVFQDPENQLVTTDVEREIAFGLENLGYPRNLIARRIEEALDTAGIAHLRFARNIELSGGEKQKVAIASVLALHPEILVLDEPTSELDPQSAEEILRLLERLNDELGLTVILIEQRLDRVVHLVDRMLVMGGGEIIADGTPREVMGGDIDGLGIGLPPVIRLMRELHLPPVLRQMRELRGKGLHLNGLPLTVKDARLELQKVLRGVKTVSFADAKAGSTPVLNIDKLWFSYGERAVLRNINLDIDRGGFIGIMGRNASGKTTLVKQFNGLLKPTRGKVRLEGVDTRKSTAASLSQKVGYVFQNPNDHLFADTVEDEIAFSLRNRGAGETEINKAVEQMLNEFELGRYRKSYPRNLSGGEKQRVALASVLAAEPEVIVLDEPTRGMDYVLKKKLINYLDDYRRRDNTVIMVSHDVETIAECAQRVVLLSEGRVVVEGNKREVLAKALLFSPQINRLAQALNSYGVADTTLTVSEMLEQIG